MNMDAAIPRELAAQANEATTLYRLTDRLYRARSAQDVYEAALDAIVGTLGCSRASILLFDEAGVMRFVASRGLSAGYREKLEGHTPWKPGERDPEPIFVSNILDTNEPAWIKDAISAEGIKALGFVPLVAQGATVGKFMIYYEVSRSFSQHEIDIALTIGRQVGFSIERARSEQAREIAVQKLRESEERFRLMSEHAPVMIWMSDPNGKCLHLNKLLREFWGVTDVATFDWATSMHPEDAPVIGRIMGEAIANRTSISLSGRYRDARGEYRVLQTDAQCRMSNGEFLGMIGVNIDITARAEADAARKQAEAHRELLIAELNHRVKNTLTVVQAIAQQTFRDTDGDRYQSFTGRLGALAHSHDLLTEGHWESVSLRDLAATAVQVPNTAEARVVLNGPPVQLSPREAVSLGMALHELLTNALKYGALSNNEGSVDIEWSRADEAGKPLTIRWREKGGPPVAPPTRKGFGTLLLQRALQHELGAEVQLDYLPSGVICVINARLRG